MSLIKWVFERLVLREVKRANPHAPSYALIESVVGHRPIFCGTLCDAMPDVVLDTLMDADGPGYNDWVFRDKLRTADVGIDTMGVQWFEDHGDEEDVIFTA